MNSDAVVLSAPRIGEIPVCLSEPEIQTLSLLWAKCLHDLFASGKANFLLFEHVAPERTDIAPLRSHFPRYVKVMAGLTMYVDIATLDRDHFQLLFERVGSGPRWSVKIRYTFQDPYRGKGADRNPEQGFRGDPEAYQTDIVMMKIAMHNPPD